MHEDYEKLGWPVQLPEAAGYEVGDTFPLMGRTAGVMRRGAWGAKRLGHADTWVDRSHPVFVGKTLVVADRFGQDDETHGTHTLATAAGFEGFAPDAEMYSYNCLPRGQGAEDLVAGAFVWLADQGCDVITASIGGSASQVIDDAVWYARKKGVWVVVAAGNGGGQPIGSPSRAATIVVLSCTREMVHSDFTDGRDWSRPNRIYAVGDPIVAAVPGGGHGAMRGTSMATPQVAAAMLYLRAAGR
jgi:subtilisin family serine protease